MVYYIYLWLVMIPLQLCHYHCNHKIKVEYKLLKCSIYYNEELASATIGGKMVA